MVHRACRYGGVGHLWVLCTSLSDHNPAKQIDMECPVSAVLICTREDNTEHCMGGFSSLMNDRAETGDEMQSFSGK